VVPHDGDLRRRAGDLHGLLSTVDLTAFGLEPRPADATVLAPHMPWSFPTPTQCLACGAGAVGVHRVMVIAYEHMVFRTTPDNRTVQEPEIAIVIVAENHAIVGNVRITREEETIGILRFFGLKTKKDRSVGDRAFDERFYVHAEDDAAARRSIGAPLREHMVRAGVTGAIELRDGLLLYRAEPDLGVRSLERALAEVHGVLDAIAPPAGYR